ncbi:MAG: hypothetical protein SGPRY_006699, partial [Prymnesium sp.]
MGDLLSTANMRLKLVDTSPVAEALYMHVLSELELPQKAQEMAERKLNQLKESAKAASAAI